MTEKDLKHIQQMNKEILFDIADLCEKHNFEYYLMYGTLLGAVRHRGTIPWDDDVDIAMPREHYQKLVPILKNELGEKYDVNIMGSGSVEYISELKIGRKDTKLYIPGTESLKIMNQVQVDIFCLDYIKVHSEKLEKFWSRLRSFLFTVKLCWDEKKLIMFFAKRSKKSYKYAAVLALYIMHGLRFLLGGEKNIEKIIYKLFVDETQTSNLYAPIGNFSLDANEPSAFMEAAYLEYEGRLLRVPRNYETCLNKWYGDYMQLPPEDKRFRNLFDEYVLEVK